MTDEAEEQVTKLPEPRHIGRRIGDVEHGYVILEGVSFCHKYCYLLRNEEGKLLDMSKFDEEQPDEEVLKLFNTFTPPAKRDHGEGLRFSSTGDPGNITIGFGRGSR